MLKTYSRLALCLLLASGLASAGFLNGGFESGDLSSWSAVGSVSVSTGYGYVELGWVSPDSGNYAAQMLAGLASASSIAAQMSVEIATLDASNNGTEAVVGSLIWQSVLANAGDVLELRWNFVDMDEMPYDDWAFYGLQYESDPTQLTRIASVASVGPDPDYTIGGWTTLTVPITQTGSYTIYIGMINAMDGASISELWIDGVSLQDNSSGPGSEIPEPATFALLAPALAALVIRSRRASKA